MNKCAMASFIGFFTLEKISPHSLLWDKLNHLHEQLMSTPRHFNHTSWCTPGFFVIIFLASHATALAIVLNRAHIFRNLAFEYLCPPAFHVARRRRWGLQFRLAKINPVRSCCCRWRSDYLKLLQLFIVFWAENRIIVSTVPIFQIE